MTGLVSGWFLAIWASSWTTPSSSSRNVAVVVSPEAPASIEQAAGAIAEATTRLDLGARVVTRPWAPGPDLEPQIRRYARDSGCDGVFWLGVDGSGLRLGWFDAPSDQFVERVFEISDAPGPLVQDQVVNVAASVLAGAFAGAEDRTELPAGEDAAGASPHSVASATSSESALAPPTQSPRSWWSVGYFGSTFSNEFPWQNGVGVGFDFTFEVDAMIGVQVDVVVPSRWHDDVVEVRLLRFSVAGLWGMRWPVGPNTKAGIVGHLAIEPVVRRSRARDDRAEASPSDVRWFSTAGVSFDLGFRPLEQLRLFLRFGPEVVLSRARYALVTPEGALRVVNPHLVRFGLRAGVGWGPRPRRRPAAGGFARRRPPGEKKE